MSEPSGGRGGRGRKIFAPRGKGRRTEAERKQLSQAEKERTQERERQYALELNKKRIDDQRIERERLRSIGRSGPGRGRGRGGYMGDARPAAGPFSAGSIIPASVASGKAFPRPWAPSNRSQQQGAGPSSIYNSDRVKRGDGFKNENNSKARPSMLFTGDVKREEDDGGYISSDPDEDTEGPRKDIDFINLASDDDDDVKDGKTSSKALTHRFNSPTFAPIRINRIEHRDRAAPVNPEAGETTRIKQQDDEDALMETNQPPLPSVKKGKQKAKDVELLGAGRKWRGVYEDEEDFVHVKEEPAEDAEKPSGAVAKPGREDHGGDTKQKRTQRPHHKEQLQLLQTEEEMAEWERYENDLDLLVSELGTIGPITAPISTEGEDAATTTTVPDQKDDRVYLFQLPPVVPNLIIPARVVIKDEPGEGPANAPTTTQPPGSSSVPSNTQETPIKIEEGADASDSTKSPSHLPTIKSGFAGKLQVYKSGKVTLNWGGTSMQVHKGMDSNFLQDIILVKKSVKEPGIDADSRFDSGGEALAFGQVRGKFVVTPDWDEFFK